MTYMEYATVSIVDEFENVYCDGYYSWGGRKEVVCGGRSYEIGKIY